MRLSNFLQLISDVDPSYRLYFKLSKNDNQSFPITKIQLESSRCLLLLGKEDARAKSIDFFINLTKKTKQKEIILAVKFKQDQIIFGIQIDSSNQIIYLI